MIFTVPGTLPGLNEILDAAKTSKYVYADMKKANTELVGWCVKRARIPKMKRAALNIIWIEPHRKRDPDNVQVGLKFIWDGLVAVGVLTNDGWKQQGPVKHTMDVDTKNPRVVVEITEVEAV